MGGKLKLIPQGLPRKYGSIWGCGLTCRGALDFGPSMSRTLGPSAIIIWQTSAPGQTETKMLRIDFTCFRETF